MISDEKNQKLNLYCKTNLIHINIKIHNVNIEQVLHFYYLGSKKTEDSQSKTDIVSRIV